MKIFQFILGLGYTFLSGICIWGLCSLIGESTNILEDVLYIFLFVGIAILLVVAAINSFKQSIRDDKHTSTYDMPIKDMMTQTRNTNENNELIRAKRDEMKKK